MPIDRSALAEAALGLRVEVASVRRVLIATVDGLPVYDDAQDLDTPRFSALGASTLGLGQRVTDVAKGGEFQEAVLQGSEASLTMYAAGHRLVLVLLVAREVNLALLHRKARAVATQLASLDRGAPEAPPAGPPADGRPFSGDVAAVAPPAEVRV